MNFTNFLRAPFLQNTSGRLLLSLTCGSNVNYYKSVHHPIPTRENSEHPGNFQNESVGSAFNEFCHFTF